ncbi:MAG: pirin family protein, partial [Bdellovibrionota bacterium]
KRFYPEDKKNQLKLIVSPSGKNGSIKIHQDVQIYASVLPSSLTLKYENPSGRHAWIQLVKGRMNLNGRNMKCGDGAAVSEHEKLTFESVELSEFILFDLG